MEHTSEQTVVGIFDEYNKAERVARDLEAAGIPRNSIQVKSNFMTGAAGRNMEYEEGRHEGGISGFFHRLFGGGDENDQSGNYAEAVRRGNAVVTVDAPEGQVNEVVRIMNTAGAIDIDREMEKYRRTGYETHDPNAAPYSYDEAAQERERFRGKGENTSIPVVEEELHVGKRAVQRGGVRVYSRVVERPVEENIELREEHVRVERRPANRPISAADTARLRDQSIEVAEMAEEPVVQKRARVREEVVVGKDTRQRTETIRDTVRRTEVEVEKLGKNEAQGAGEVAYADDFRSDYQQRYASSGDDYTAYQPAYEYGYRTANDPQYRGRDWSDVEETLRTDYMRNNPNSSWDRMKGAVRYGWEKVTRKR